MIRKVEKYLDPQAKREKDKLIENDEYDDETIHEIFTKFYGLLYFFYFFHTFYFNNFFSFDILTTICQMTSAIISKNGLNNSVSLKTFCGFR